ncbi:MAG TPA: hypothetical protein VMD99_04295 [Terriglobales bacterium]|nr:hypothetical protein [Terriglobales bacterium]
MATMTEAQEAASNITPSHDYHAEAHVLSGHLKRPIEQKIELQAPVSLNDRRGGHLTRYVDDFSIEGLISFTKGETRVSGARSLKTNGWVTLSTSILEGLNVFEIIAADRIVSQVSTEHPYVDGHVPKVTFLGTQFKNFQVGGFPVTLTLNLGFCGDRPAGGRAYLQDPNFLEKVRGQTAKIAGARGLPKALKEQYDERLAYIQQLISICDEGDTSERKPITCSLVQSIGEIPIPGVESFGHVLVIPEFGSVALGEVEIGEKMYEGSTRACVYFTLTTVKMKLGCVGDGEAAAGSSTSNGHTVP